MATLRTVRVGPSAGADYSTLTAAEAGEQGDYVLADEIVQFLCENFEDTTEVRFDGSTTDSERYALIEAEDAHGGVWSTSAYRRVVGIGSTSSPNRLDDDYVRVVGVQFEMIGQASLIGTCVTPNGAVILFDKVILRRSGAASSSEWGLFSGGFNNPAFYVRNSVVYEGWVTAGIQGQGGNDGSPGAYVDNVTVHGCAGAGIASGGSGRPVVARNCIVQGCTGNDFDGTFHADADYNVSEDATAPGSNSLTSTAITFDDEAGGNFRPVTGSAGIDAGMDLSGLATYPVVDDIVGTARPQNSVYDIGAFEEASTGEVAQATETDTALGITASKLVATGLAAESDTALATLASKLIATGLATEVDVALAVLWAKALQAGQASESDLALAATVRKLVTIGLASEIDAALALVAAKAVELAEAPETDTALTVTSDQSIVHAVGLASETDVAQALGRLKEFGLGLAVEVDAALGTAVLTGTPVGQASEADSALAVEWAKALGLGLATETNVAPAVTVVRIVGVGLSDEADAALSVALERSFGLGLAIETDVGRLILPAKTLAVGLAMETDTAVALVEIADGLVLFLDVTATAPLELAVTATAPLNLTITAEPEE